jgi:hypothetical protein
MRAGAPAPDYQGERKWSNVMPSETRHPAALGVAVFDVFRSE